MLIDGHYTITGGQPLGVPDAFGAVAAALGLATATARTLDEIAEHVANLPRPAVLEVRYEERDVARPVAVRRPAGRPLALRGRRRRALTDLEDHAGLLGGVEVGEAAAVRPPAPHQRLQAAPTVGLGGVRVRDLEAEWKTPSPRSSRNRRCGVGPGPGWQSWIWMSPIHA